MLVFHLYIKILDGVRAERGFRLTISIAVEERQSVCVADELTRPSNDQNHRVSGLKSACRSHSGT